MADKSDCVYHAYRALLLVAVVQIDYMYGVSACNLHRFSLSSSLFAIFCFIQQIFNYK